MSYVNYIDCANNADSLDSILKRLIYVDADGYLAIRTTCSGNDGDGYVDCFTNSDSVESILRRLFIVNGDGNKFLNT